MFQKCQSIYYFKNIFKFSVFAFLSLYRNQRFVFVCHGHTVSFANLGGGSDLDWRKFCISLMIMWRMFFVFLEILLSLHYGAGIHCLGVQV